MQLKTLTVMLYIMEKTLRVAVLGASGRMGTVAVSAIREDPALELVATINRYDSLNKLVENKAQIVVDLTNVESTQKNVHFAVENGMHAVVGASGWDFVARENLQKVLSKNPKVGVVVAPNFSLAAVLASKFASQAAKYFESVEIIELHHPDKLDAPSATAVRTAELISSVREDAQLSPVQADATINCLPGARGADVAGVPIHSVRLRGLVAHQQVLFGSVGEQLTIKHDSFDRACFMPGLLLAVKKISHRPGLTYGLDKFVDFS